MIKLCSLRREDAALLKRYGLDAAALTGCQVFCYEQNEFVMQQGERLKWLCAILSGTAKICVGASNGRNLILRYYVSEGLFGDLELMSEDETASTTVIAVSELRCAAIPIAENERALRGNLAFVSYVAKEQALSLRDRGEAHMVSALFSSEERLCSYLLATAHNGIMTEYLTDMAQSVGVSYRHALRIIGKLCADGILQKTAGGYRILDETRLQARSCDGRT